MARHAARRLVVGDGLRGDVRRWSAGSGPPRAAPAGGGAAPAGARPRSSGRCGTARPGRSRPPRRRPDRRPLAEPRQRGQRRQERPGGRVLRLVLVAQLVDRVAVHLGHVLPIQGVEPGRVRPRCPHQRPIEVEAGDARATGRLRPCHPSSMPVGPSRYTPTASGAGVGPARRTWRISPTTTARSPDDARSSATTRAPLAASTPRARTVVSAPAGSIERPRRGRSSAGGRSSRRRRSGRRGAPRCGPRAGTGSRRAGRRGRSGRPCDASRSEVIVSASSGGKSAAAQSRVDAEADDDPRVVRPEPGGLAEHAGHLAHARRTLGGATRHRAIGRRSR